MQENVQHAVTKSYDVGFGKPPQKHQWKAGQSGNPLGRAKSPQSLEATFKMVAVEKITVTIGGETLKLTWMQAVIKAAFSHAYSGKAGFSAIVQSWITQFTPSPAEEKAVNSIGKIVKHGKKAYVQLAITPEDVAAIAYLTKHMVPLTNDGVEEAFDAGEPAT